MSPPRCSRSGSAIGSLSSRYDSSSRSRISCAKSERNPSVLIRASLPAVNALLAFAAALLALRLTGLLARRWRATRRPELAAWAWSLAAYAVAAAAIAWGESAQWDARAFRVYYAAGALITVPLLGAGSLLLAGARRAGAAACVVAGVGIGVALAMPVHGAFARHGIPPAQDHLDWLPRALAIAFNSVGTLAVVG